MSQSINNFSDYDISQTHDWECPSLSPHVLLVLYSVLLSEDIFYFYVLTLNNESQEGSRKETGRNSAYNVPIQEQVIQ